MTNYFETPCAQGTAEWHLARRGHLTASQFHALMRGDPAPKNLLLRKLNAEIAGRSAPKISSKAMAWGTHYEPEARALYAMNFPAAREAGYFARTDFSGVGCSPDGIVEVGNSAVVDGGLEIKCPFTDASHERHMYGIIPLNYYWQIQFSIWVTEANWWDFVSYNPRFDGQRQFYVKRFKRDPLVMTAILNAVSEFCHRRDGFETYPENPLAKDMLAAGIIPKFF